MSVQAISWALKQQVGNPVAKLVLIALANYADADGYCWPSQALLAAECGISLRCVRENLTRLEMVGAIDRKERRRPDGTRRSDGVSLKIQRENNQAADNAACEDELPADTAACTPSTGRLRPHQPADSAGPVRDKLLLEPTISEPSESSRKRVRRPKPPLVVPKISFPPDWAPSPAMRTFAERIGISAAETDAAGEDFKAFWLANPNERRTAASWSIAFQNNLKVIAVNPKLRAKLELVMRGAPGAVNENAEAKWAEIRERMIGGANV